MAEMEDRWLSISEICKYLGVSNDTVYKWMTTCNPPHGSSLEVQER